MELFDRLKNKTKIDESNQIGSKYKAYVYKHGDYLCILANRTDRLQKGLCFLDDRKPDDAIQSFKEALKISKDCAEAHNNLGVALFLKNKKDADAIAEFNEALRLKPNYAEAHNNLGSALEWKDQKNEALLRYREALRHEPNSAEIHNNLGVALRKQNAPDEAIIELKAALRLKPEFAEVYSNLGELFRSKNLNDDVTKYYVKAIELKPLSNPWIFFQYFYSLQRNNEKALEAYNNYVQCFLQEGDYWKL